MSENKTHAVPDTVIVFTHQMPQLAEFYARALDLEEPQASGAEHIGFQLPNLYLGFDQVEGWGSPNSSVTLWFRVDDIDATFQRMVQLGAKVRYTPVDKPFGDRVAAVYDPDGNMVGLSQRKNE